MRRYDQQVAIASETKRPLSDLGRAYMNLQGRVRTNGEIDMTLEDNIISLEKLVSLPVQFFGATGRASKRIAFVSNKTGQMEIHLLDLRSGEFSQLTHGEYPLTPLGYHRWAPDDSYILFPKDPVPGNEKNNIYRVSVSTGEVTQLTDTPEFRDDIAEVSHDSRHVVFASDRSDGICQIFRMMPDGSRVTKLTDHTRPVAWWSDVIVSPDDEWIAYSTNESENLQNLEVWIVRMDGSERRKLFGVCDGSKETVHDWSKDGSMLLVKSDHSGIDKAGVYHLESGEIEWFGEENAPERPIRFTGNDGKIVVGRDIDAERQILLYDLATGKERTLSLPPGYAEAHDITYDGRHLLISHEDSTHRKRFLLYDLQEHVYDLVIPAEYGDFTPEDFHPDEYIHYRSGDIEIPAILYRPKEIEENAQLPAIIIPHGGPTWHYSRMFYDYVQAFVSKGYVVLLPNIRGSTGYGVEFRDACLNDWGGKDLDDIEAGVSYLRGFNYVDPERIGIFGGSYGGYMTFMAVTKIPKFWKAASAYVGISSLIHNYNRCKDTFPDISYYFEEQMGNPEDEEVRALWEQRSAINFVENVKARLQMIHAENDPRCHIEQSEMFRDRLLELGRKEGEDFEFVRLTETGHGSWDTDQRIRWIRHVVDFFDRNL